MPAAAAACLRAAARRGLGLLAGLLAGLLVGLLAGMLGTLRLGPLCGARVLVCYRATPGGKATIHSGAGFWGAKAQ